MSKLRRRHGQNRTDRQKREEDRVQWVEARWPDGLPRACQRLRTQAGRTCAEIVVGDGRQRGRTRCSPCTAHIGLIAAYETIAPDAYRAGMVRRNGQTGPGVVRLHVDGGAGAVRVPPIPLPVTRRLHRATVQTPPKRTKQREIDVADACQTPAAYRQIDWSQVVRV